MKKIITAIIFSVFFMSVVIFSLFGSQIRASLSPKVKYAYVQMIEWNDTLVYAIPVSALWQDENVISIWRVNRADLSNESLYKTERVIVNPVDVDDNYVYLSLNGEVSSGDAIVVEWEDRIENSMYVLISKCK